jgi:hypothetical protein
MVSGVKELADGAGDQRLLGPVDVAEHVAREVDLMPTSA